MAQLEVSAIDSNCQVDLGELITSIVKVHKSLGGKGSMARWYLGALTRSIR